MFNFLKKNKEVVEEVKKIDFVALDLLMHVALADGSIAKDEIDNVLQYIKENYPNEDKEKTYLNAYKKMNNSTSFFEEIKAININFDRSQKESLLKDIWMLIIADGKIDPYEENIFYRVGELLKIKRSTLNKIKSGFK
tara:strand:- start:528 stop:941 length:414 start_codon:yes stop_codon:yes gene_type:complete